MIKYLDTETVGFHGPTVLIQYADGIDGEVHIHNVWKERIIDTLLLIEDITESGVVGFNLSFDWFHLCQTYTTLVLLMEKVGGNAYPEDHIDLYAELEPLARDGNCLKPATALDLMLFARKGPYQSTMDRRNINIRKVPKPLAGKLIKELNERIKLKDIYFARQTDKSKRWEIKEIKGDRDFVNIELVFKPSAALKVLVKDALGKDERKILMFGDVNVSKKYMPLEAGYAPFAKAISSKENGWYCDLKIGKKTKKGYAWPKFLTKHIDHWEYNKKAREYAKFDVVYLQELHKFFELPEPGDDDSVLACMVAAVRWRGFAIDIEELRKYREECILQMNKAPKHSTHVKYHLSQVMDDVEKEFIKDTTNKGVLEKISKWKNEDGTLHPAGLRAAECLAARQAQTKISNIDKLLQAGRFHVSLKVIGTLSGRMAGTDGLNATGIQHEKRVRKCFTLALPGMQLNGGDFESFEISIADAIFDDAGLRKQLLTCSRCEYTRAVAEQDDLECPACRAVSTKCKKCRKSIYTDVGLKPLDEPCCNEPTPDPEVENTLRKIHGLFAMCLEEGLTYDDVVASKGSKNDLYDKGKRGIFSQLFGGNFKTLVNRGICTDEEVAKNVELKFSSDYPGVGKARLEIQEMFCSMRQPDGLGSAVEWHEPEDYIESLNGNRRYFTLENAICKSLFELANEPPKEWRQIRVRCVRRDREQWVGGATQSAVYAAAFNIQASNERAASNHRIQATGSKETKRLQVRLWSVQPVGISPWKVQPFNIHDEIMAPSVPEVAAELKQIVRDFILERRCLIPLLRMTFSITMKTWADK